MKRYKLLKDTPIAPKGEIFQEYKKNKDIFLYWLDKNGAERSTEFRKATIFNFDEWFEEVKEFEEWKPQYGETYKFMHAIGVIARNDYGHVDGDIVSTGNCYPLDTPDEVIIKEQKLIPQAMHRLKMAAKKAWFEFDGSEGPDWSSHRQVKWAVYYDHIDKRFVTDNSYFIQCQGLIYFPTKKSVQYVIDNIQDDLKLLFGVK